MEDKLDTIILLLERLIAATEKKQYTGGMYAAWSLEQEDFILNMYYEKASIADIILAVKKEFDITRSEGAITTRLRRLGVTSPFKEDNNELS